MKIEKRKQLTGFTLLELLIVVAIVGLLAGIGYPSYTTFMEKGRRSIVKSELLAYSNALEQFYVQNGSSYLDGAGNLPANIYPTNVTIDNKVMYTIGIVGNAGSFTLTATPVTGTAQENDGFLTINNAGVRTWEHGVAGAWD